MFFAFNFTHKRLIKSGLNKAGTYYFIVKPNRHKIIVKLMNSQKQNRE